MDIEWCWENEYTGCICGNECEPPQWMKDMWKAELKDKETE